MSFPNPITAFISDTMEAYADREASMKDRVSSTAIMAQKIVDERHNTHRPNNYWQRSGSARDFDHFYVASSTFKGKDEGCVNSFKTMKYYSDESAKERDELLREIAEEAKAVTA
jgi:hypothetical protein